MRICSITKHLAIRAFMFAIFLGTKEFVVALFEISEKNPLICIILRSSAVVCFSYKSCRKLATFTQCIGIV